MAYGWIGVIYQCGLGVPVNIPLALENYKRGASLGFVAAEHAWIHLSFKHGTLKDKFLAAPRIGMLIIKAVRMLLRNRDDIRLANVAAQPIRQDR
ncbi:MAG: SEL1-like repeat protein [Acidiferrobacterales bacterium]